MTIIDLSVSCKIIAALTQQQKSRNEAKVAAKNAKSKGKTTGPLTAQQKQSAQIDQQLQGLRNRQVL
jgi:hypothetical protein